MDRRLRLSTRGEMAGFTLVELLAVLLILGLLTAIVALRVSDLTHTSRLEWGLGRLVHFDADLRSYARNHDVVASLEFELGSPRLIKHYGDRQGERKEETVGDRITVRRFISPTQDIGVGRVKMEYATSGISPTYALEIQGAGKSQPSVWLVFLGTTGRCLRLQEEQDARQLVKYVAEQGLDTR